tara:strand:- start:65 stop:202 length:138 start_codon:yes stop_codon:yes gene_type:complete
VKVRKMIVGATGFELVSHPRQKLRGHTMAIQDKKELYQRRFIYLE